ncbi:MAG TPA: hypothetical protein VNO30_03280 [Kofleriaceae bacterium]|nr:hypothetical protein [Kofleriaceae bacterium]
MRLPSQLWLRAVLVATAAVFVGVAGYLYGLRFFEWIESDASVTALLAAKSLDAKLPVVSDWYYVNRDVWVLAPHLFAILPVAVLGVGPGSLLVAVAAGFIVEVAALTALFTRLCGERWVGLFAAMVTLMAWSPAHVAFVYIQLAYGFLSVLYVLAFGSFAMLAANAPARPRRWAAAGLFVSLVIVQNPTRGGVFIVAPLLVGCLWPWRGLALRRRLALAATAVGAWGLAFVIYTALLLRAVSFSYPLGHIDFVVRDASGIQDNLAMLGRSLLLLCGGTDELALRTLPGMAVMAGALALVGRELFASRAIAATRFLGIVVVAQLGALLVPLIIGNLLVSPSSGRYLMPSLLAVFGLAALLAVRALAEGAGWWRRLAIGWLAAVPLAALLAVAGTRPPTPVPYAWPDAAEHEQLGAELARRGLTHGFSSVLNANILNLVARGAVTICPVYFAHLLIPQRWLADTSCYTASALPEQFFVVTDHDERDEQALRATLPPPAERFHVGDTYEVSVFRTAEVPLLWLELPLREGKDAVFPMRLAAAHPALQRGKGVAAGNRVIATGQEGYVVYGPYMKLPKGRFRARWIGNGFDSPGWIIFIVAADAGKEELARITLPARDLPRERGQLVEIPFKLPVPREGVELTVFSKDGGRVALDELVLERR